MELGISSFAYSWAIGIPEYKPLDPMNAEGLIHKAKSLGLNRVQYGDNLPLHILDSRELQALIKLTEKEGIQVEVGMRGLIPDLVKKYLSIGEKFNSPFLRVVIDTHNYEPEPSEIINIINNLLPILKEKRIRLAIENHDRLKDWEFAELVTKTDPDWVGICLDTINSFGADQSIGEVLSTLAPYTINFHVKDYLIRRKWHNMGFEVTGSPAGQGMMPIQSILKELEKYGKCHSAILELWTEPGKDVDSAISKENEWAIESIRYLKQIIN